MRDIDLSFGDYDNRTPLHLAASNGHIKTVKYLVEYGGIPDINVKDRWGGTPYDDAIRENHKEVTEYLKSKNAKKGKEIKQDAPVPNPVPEKPKLLLNNLLFSQLT